MKRLALALLVLAACRIGFDEHEGENFDSPDASSRALADPECVDNNLVVDPGFEQGDPSWRTDLDATYERISGGRDSSAYRGRACRGTTANTILRDYAVRTSITLPSNELGAMYRMTAYVQLTRSSSAAARFQLYNGTILLDEMTVKQTVAPTWTRLELDYTITKPGGVTANAEVLGMQGPDDKTYCIDVDDVCVVRLK